MTFTDFKIRYKRAYDKLNDGHNMMDDERTESQLKVAYDMYTDPYSPYYKKLNPTKLAKLDVLWTDVQVQAAVDWAWDYDAMCYAEACLESGQSKDDLLTYLLGCREALSDLMHEFFRNAF